MKKFVALSLILWSMVAYSTQGSMMTNKEEAQALANDSDASGVIQSASSSFSQFLDQYRSGTINHNELSMHYQVICMQLSTGVAKAIENDTTGKIKLIALDYDTSHQTEYHEHLWALIGMAQSILEIPAYKCILPPYISEKNLLVNGDFSQKTEGWALSGGAATLVVNPPGTLDATSPVADN